jgi:hypothetical protein
MRNDDELEIRLVSAVHDDLVQRLGKRLDIFSVEISGRLVKRNDLAITLA